MKLTAYILAFALLLSSVGISLFYFPQMEAIHQNSAHKYPEKNRCLILTFGEKAFEQLIWTQKEKEFRFADKMYDVLSVKRLGNKVLVSCVFDAEETGLRQKLKDFFSPASDKNHPIRQAVRVLSQKYFSVGFAVFPHYSPLSVFSFKPYFYSLSLFENGPDNPPPVV